MSRHHSSSVQDVNRIVNDMTKLNDQELNDLYGLIVDGEGYLDTTYNIKLNSVAEWATFNAENDHCESFEHFTHDHNDYS
jgi:hypothetical protein